MYYDDCIYKRGDRTYRRDLLRESRRVNGKVVKRTVANITDWPELVKEAIRVSLAARRGRGFGQHADGTLTAALAAHAGYGALQQGKSVGAVATVLAVAKRLGITQALGNERQGRLALYQVLARVLEQGSRLSAVRQASHHLGAELLGLERFDEDDLYANLDWLHAHQEQIEDRLFATDYGPGKQPGLFLYDVTSSYFEGTENELAAFGYNRDGKKGKKQVVAGLLTAGDGTPLSIELFPGNSADPGTVGLQIAKLRERFGGGEVTLVGDRGMLKRPQQQALAANGMHYLTAITDAQINSLLKSGTIQLELFDQALAEVVVAEQGIRYILRCNPAQAERMAARRADQLASWERLLAKTNAYLAEHPRASVKKAMTRLANRAGRLRLNSWVSVSVNGRCLQATIDANARAEAAKLDGCYVLQSDLPVTQVDASTLDQRYHDLSQVEWAFRNCKTAHLELRPIYLRRAERTRAHAFVVMLAYRIVRELARCWQDIDQTVEENLRDLSQLCVMEVGIPGGFRLQEIPQPRVLSARLLQAAEVVLPAIIPPHSTGVDTKTKLPSRRKSRR